ncbi:Hypothetical protein PAS_chr4_0591 [Komagataella phaffii GS115]|uniref:Uncharacterized protein n=1 Tax=Komagataella phaffii (strain GS115 / ATCC 20864) TaxID=644223 RepID=C4R8C6_KOMPG|nr:Hypothetical protein PAS_chr4_0591 [Komagataella phaffii GS115]CAY71851.1 Hypothetical protein PAS_chr4_0591 [Komagataella phaffii GS115]
MSIPNLRKIVADLRTEEEERMYSRKAFYNFIGFVASCLAFTLISQRAAN